MGVPFSGNLEREEEMLFDQAATLQSIFFRLSSGALGFDGEVHESFLRMALKAQAQCVNTLMALQNLKHPQSQSTIKQTNNINQDVQITQNQAILIPTSLEMQNSSNELLEAPREQWLDPRTASAPSSTDSNLEPIPILQRP